MKEEGWFDAISPHDPCLPHTYVYVSNNRLPPIHSRQFFFQPLEQLESLPTPSILLAHQPHTHI